MATFRSLGALATNLDKLARAIGAEGARQMADAVGEEAQRVAARAAANDLGGDPKFSGWAPVLDTKVRPLEPGALILTPTRSSAGPWTVAEFGRNTKAGPRQVGPKLTKTGKVSKAKTKRWNGRTRGKGTASDAVAAIERVMPKVVEREMAKVVGRFLD